MKGKIASSANLPTEFGTFEIIIFDSGDKKEHLALVKGNVAKKQGVLTRVHSECLTGDAFGSLRCDCREQLLQSMQLIQKQKEGILLYLRQEGRGIGLTAKIKAYKLQEQGFDTIEANTKLGFREDERDFAIAASMLKALDVESIKLITNNPKKVEQLKAANIKIIQRVPLEITHNKHNHHYLKTKRDKAGHLLNNL